MLGLFSFDYAPLDGGIARLCTQLRDAHDALGGDTRVITAAADTPSEPNVIRLRGPRLAREARALEQLRRLPERTPVLCGRWYPEAALALAARRSQVFVLAHGAELLPASSARRALGWQRLRRLVLESSTLILANSAYTAKLAREQAPRAKVTAIPLGVDTAFFSPGDKQLARQSLGLDGELVISTVSRLQPFKGHDVVLRALASLPPQIASRFRYVVTGRGPHEGAIRELARRLGLETRVKLTGLISDRQLREVYRASDLFCLLTRQTSHAVEGFGLALLEAQSCGVPVLGTRTGGIPDALVDGSTGWLVREDDAQAVAEHLKHLATEPQFYRAVGAAGRERAELDCTWLAYARRVREAIGS
jgi:phosphatidylinositol alpha-1,6-mannosyltransferase